MIGIGVATAAAGIIVGTLAQTGAHAVIVDVVEQLAGGNLILLLVLVAVLSLILGMGLPTTANYIIVSSLMAPVIIAVGEGSGLFVPLIAVHMFVFYFGILADDTPPVGLAAYAAAAISRGDPIKTGIQGFTYDIRTAALPFIVHLQYGFIIDRCRPNKYCRHINSDRYLYYFISSDAAFCCGNSRILHFKKLSVGNACIIINCLHFIQAELLDG